MTGTRFVLRLAEVANHDVARVGGKNASLGEMIRHLETAGIRVPGGFAVTADAYRHFIDGAALKAPIESALAALEAGSASLQQTGRTIRDLVCDAQMPDDLASAILAAYRDLDDGDALPAVAVRSSATAEDLPEASFAGQLDSYLNILGDAALLSACRRCFASLFTDRAITYRQNRGFDHMQVAVSVGVQRMVRSDTGAAGVMFSIDPESGFPDAVLISANWGLGESVVQGAVDPDEYVIFKPLLADSSKRPIIGMSIGRKTEKMVLGTDDEPTRSVETSREERLATVLADDDILQLARWAVAIEDHYGRPMDVEWARDGETGELFVVQARPETVQSARPAIALKTYVLERKGRRLASGQGIGENVAVGRVCRLSSAAEIERFEDGAVLVTARTDPDWVPIMKRAAAIVTDHGGRTSHAAIVSRELGLPAVIGTGDATRALTEGQEVTVSCAEGDQGFVYEGIADFQVRDIELDEIPSTRTRIMLNLADPSAALRWWRLPCDGVGLARMEFIINNIIKVHPMALLHPERVRSDDDRRRIEALTAPWSDPARYFVDTLSRGVARIAASRHPHPVIVRMSDFKTNEYARLLGGEAFEPTEANPMLGFRGASRYYSDEYREGFALECRAIVRVREEIGLDNVVVMIPFCRTPQEADRVLEVMAANGLTRAAGGLEVFVMAEVPSNVVLADAFSQRFDGFSIGSNDLTQLVLGVDRDSDRLAELFDDRHDAVRRCIRQLIDTAHAHGRKVGLCGEAPSSHPEYARFLVECGIDSISVNPDSFAAVKRHVAEAEREL